MTELTYVDNLIEQTWNRHCEIKLTILQLSNIVGR